MAVSVGKVVSAIAQLNNRYRDMTRPTRERLEALWDMGNQLFLLGVENPHSLGWKVQRETQGLIKRPTVFRSHKIRSIWHSKKELLDDLGGITGLSVLTEMLPVIDPAQRVRSQLSQRELRDLFHHAVEDSPSQFKRYVAKVKSKFASGRLGKALNRQKHLRELGPAVSGFRRMFEAMSRCMMEETRSSRDKVRAGISAQELRTFANMCIALTTKENVRLYRIAGPPKSEAEVDDFRLLYDAFRDLLGRKSDVERARLRRLLSADVLAKMSDMLSSVVSEDGVVDFRARQDMAIRI